MARNRIPLLTLAAVVAAAGITVFVVKNRDSAPAGPAATAASPEAAPAPPPTHVSLRNGRVTQPGAAAATVTPEQMAARRADADRQIHAALARMDAEFQQQATGTGLASQQSRAQALLSDPLLAKAIARPTSAEFECRQRQCRLTAEFAPGAPPDDWLTRLSTAGSSILPNAQVGRVRLPDGRTQLVGYFSGAETGSVRPYKGQRP